jgi:hypothetical protein
MATYTITPNRPLRADASPEGGAARVWSGGYVLTTPERPGEEWPFPDFWLEPEEVAAYNEALRSSPDREVARRAAAQVVAAAVTRRVPAAAAQWEAEIAARARTVEVPVEEMQRLFGAESASITT